MCVPQDLNTFRILVIDDQRDTRHVARVLLTSAGHIAETAASLDEAIAAAQAFRPEIVLADLRLPAEGQGIELARRLRANSDSAILRLFALTGSTDPREHTAALAAGFDEILIKPLDYKLFIQKLTMIVGQSPRTS